MQILKELAARLQVGIVSRAGADAYLEAKIQRNPISSDHIQVRLNWS